jgi:hypothetical protein
MLAMDGHAQWDHCLTTEPHQLQLTLVPTQVRLTWRGADSWYLSKVGQLHHDAVAVQLLAIPTVASGRLHADNR